MTCEGGDADDKAVYRGCKITPLGRALKAMQDKLN